MLISNLRKGDVLYDGEYAEKYQTLAADSPRFLEVTSIFITEGAPNSYSALQYSLTSYHEITTHGVGSYRGGANIATRIIFKDVLWQNMSPIYRKTPGCKVSVKDFLRNIYECWYLGLEVVDEEAARMGWRRIDTEPDSYPIEDDESMVALEYETYSAPAMLYLSRFFDPGSVVSIDFVDYKVLTCDNVKRDWEVPLEGVKVKAYAAMALRVGKQKQKQKRWFGK